MVYISIMTNMYLVCMATDQIESIFPHFKALKEDKDIEKILAFILRDFLVIICFTMHYIFNRKPDWVELYHKREQYRM
jgi:hypothetical protein